MKAVSLVFLFLISWSNFTTSVEKLPDQSASISSVVTTIHGYPGEKIDMCIEKRIKGQDIDHLVEPFKVKNETWCWQSEFWGKWMLSAVTAYEYNQDPELFAKMTYAVEGLLQTQMQNGYIGNYGPENQLTRWDIWGRKYSMLGLIRFYEISKDNTVLTAAQRIADHLINQIGPTKTNIIKTGFYRGMASSSVLESMVYLYNLTKDQKYLDFAKYIVAEWETSDGPKLISKALQGVPVRDRFPHPPTWWSWENGQKAYEMMSCYDGLLELYKVTGETSYLSAVIKTVEDIMDAEINIAGSGSAFECWYGGVTHQTHPTYHTMETCVTTTWMKLCRKLWELTKEPKYADHIERSFFNALMASMKYDGSQIVKYSPLEGRKQAGEQQCSMDINCCNANGPRGFVMIPDFAAFSSGSSIYLNYYGSSNTEISLSTGNRVKINQITSYPASGNITFNIQVDRSESFSLLFRIPGWSQQSNIKVNGMEVRIQAPGSYTTVTRVWEPGDQIELQLDMRGKLHTQDGFQSVTRGPIVLARDTRFEDGYVDEAAVVQHQNEVVQVMPVEQNFAHIWLSFKVPMIMGTDLEGEGQDPVMKYFCDFASAGNTWMAEARYRVWIPQTMHVMSTAYEKY